MNDSCQYGSETLFEELSISRYTLEQCGLRWTIIRCKMSAWVLALRRSRVRLRPVDSVRERPNSCTGPIARLTPYAPLRVAC